MKFVAFLKMVFVNNIGYKLLAAFLALLAVLTANVMFAMSIAKEKADESAVSASQTIELEWMGE